MVAKRLSNACSSYGFDFGLVDFLLVLVFLAMLAVPKCVLEDAGGPWWRTSK